MAMHTSSKKSPKEYISSGIIFLKYEILPLGQKKPYLSKNC